MLHIGDWCMRFEFRTSRTPREYRIAHHRRQRHRRDRRVTASKTMRQPTATVTGWRRAAAGHRWPF